jgi:hypothetical protein
LDNLSVTITGGTAPYTVTVPGLTAASTTTTLYSYTSTFSEATTSSDTISSEVEVTDANNDTPATCLITVDSTQSGSTGDINITQTLESNGTILLTATDEAGISNPVFTFSTDGAAYVSSSQQSNNTAIISSTAATTATIYVTESTSGSSTVSESATISLTFSTASTGSGSSYCSATCTGSVSCTLGVQYDSAVSNYVFYINGGSGCVSSVYINGGVVGFSYPFAAPFELPFTLANGTAVYVQGSVNGYCCNSSSYFGAYYP